jgi:hypothetical protein
MYMAVDQPRDEQSKVEVDPLLVSGELTVVAFNSCDPSARNTDRSRTPARKESMIENRVERTFGHA